MARRALPEMSPWKRHPLTIPPDSWRAWLQLAVWEFWMGLILSGALIFGVRLIVTAPRNIVTMFDFTNCYTADAVLPCERVAYRAGGLNVTFNAWCGLLLVAVAAWLLWELWTAVAPRPVTDDFLKLLDESFGTNWRSLRTWPWARIGWAYGFTSVGVVCALGIGLLMSSLMASSALAKPPAPHVETSQQFRLSE
jgi:hypothetical protein